MSFAVRPEQVMAVLLIDGWHRVEPGSFRLDAFEIVDDDGPLHGGGSGFAFDEPERERLVYGPITSILAVDTWGSDDG